VSLRLVFMGTPDFAVATLERLVERGHAVVCVYTQPPQPAGRGLGPRPSPVQQAAERRGIALSTPASLKPEPAWRALQALAPDLLVVVAYGLILPPPALAAARLGAYNLHASLLPRWRGAAPIQRAIMAGDAETGIVVMRMAEELDSGPVCLAERVAITPGMTAGALSDLLAERGARLMVRAVDALEDGALACHPQPGAGVTYAAKIDKSEARLAFDRPAAEIVDRIHGLSPHPGAWCRLAGRRLKLLAAAIVPGGVPQAGPGRAVPAGTCLDDRLTIACAEAALRPLLVQLEGKAALPVDDFLRGHPVAPGTRLA
jgi:methionyl-tRNA formyltransferase